MTYSLVMSGFCVFDLVIYFDAISMLSVFSMGLFGQNRTDKAVNGFQFVVAGKDRQYSASALEKTDPARFVPGRLHNLIGMAFER